jgi:hypothetical protein
MRSAALPELAELDHLLILPWPDPVIDELGHDPRSPYVEHFWLGVLGPSTTWLLRRTAAGLEAEPEGFELPLRDTARALGLGGEGRHSPFVRALTRCCQFELARPAADGSLEVRRMLPPLNRRQLARLPETIQVAHQRWIDDALRTPSPDRERDRTRRLALSLVELGESRDEVERQLLRWRFRPEQARSAATWAMERHIADCTGQPPTPLPTPLATTPAPAAAPPPDGPDAA